MFHRFLDLMDKGGPVLWLLLVMSIVTVTVIVERAWFWLRTNGPAGQARVARLEQLLRRGDVQSAAVLVEDDKSVYGRIVRRILAEGFSESVATSAVESQRPRIDRYMSFLSTTITAAPYVGLLGTVIGLILTFRLLSEQANATDPRSVGIGLAEALLNTAAGLVVALVVIYPYNLFRVQVDRTLGRIESLLAAASVTPASVGEERKPAVNSRP